MSKHVGEKCGKLWRTDGRTDGDPDGRTDGHHHTIIRPVWRRAYKKSVEILYFWNCIICLPFTELGSIEELWENLIERKPSVDRDILQLACDGKLYSSFKMSTGLLFQVANPVEIRASTFSQILWNIWNFESIQHWSYFNRRVGRRRFKGDKGQSNTRDSVSTVLQRSVLSKGKVVCSRRRNKRKSTVKTTHVSLYWISEIERNAVYNVLWKTSFWIQRTS